MNSVTLAREERQVAWRRLAAKIDREKLAGATTTIRLDEVIGAAAEITEGKVRGRMVVDLT